MTYVYGLRPPGKTKVMYVGITNDMHVSGDPDQDIPDAWRVWR